MTQELLTTFNDDNLSAVTLVPSNPPPGGRFVVWHDYFSNTNSEDSENAAVVLWDRAEQDGFPDIKDLKQLVRDKISPDLYLGHSDNKERQAEDGSSSTETDNNMVDLPPPSSELVLSKVMGTVKDPNVAIQYCTGCRWMLRAAFFGTELMTTFKDEINSLTLIPSRPPEKGGIFVSTVLACLFVCLFVCLLVMNPIHRMRNLHLCPLNLE